MNNMRISEILKNTNDNFGIYKIIRDEKFGSLGLVGSNVNLKLCTFIEDEKYIDEISSNVSMIITNDNIAKKIKNKGVCISKNPKISFKLHNHLAETSNYTKTKNLTDWENCKISPLASVAIENVK